MVAVTAGENSPGLKLYAEWGDDQAAARVGGIRLGMARRAERHQPVEIEVRAPLGALDDVVDLEGAPAATGLAPPAGASEHQAADRRPLGPAPRTFAIGDEVPGPAWPKAT